MTFRDDMAVIDWVIIKGRHMVVLVVLQKQALQHLHVNHMGIEKSILLECDSIYWIGMNPDIENHIKNCSACLDFQQTQLKKKNYH